MARFLTAIGLLGAQLACCHGEPRSFDDFPGPLAQVIGGEEPDFEPPWIVAFLEPGSPPFCAGTVVSSTSAGAGTVWVLTAAHCGIREEDHAVIGTRRVAPDSPGRQVLQVCPHPQFDSGSFSFDLAMVRVAGTAGEALGFPDSATQLTTGTVMGWGLTENNTQPQDLLAAEVGILEEGGPWPPVCEALKGDRLSPLLCAGDPQSGPCFGDSGGPLLVKQDDGWLLAGVFSDLAPACGEAVFEDMRTAEHQAWVGAVVAAADDAALEELCKPG